jgi:hypothetical protein
MIGNINNATGDFKMRVTHLENLVHWMVIKTACGRNLLRTAMSANWSEFKQEPVQFRCIKCVTSKQFESTQKWMPRKS